MLTAENLMIALVRACLLAFVASIAVGCAGTLGARASTDGSAAAEPSFAPSAGDLSGRVVSIGSSTLLLDSGGVRRDVDLRNVIGVWAETRASIGDIDVGDDVFINGTEGEPFYARYIWINLSTIKGTIVSLDSTGMTLSLVPSGIPARVEFSQFVSFGSVDGTVHTTRADLVVGRAVGAVVYQPKSGAPRATRVW